MLPPPKVHPNALLRAAYTELGFSEGTLLPATKRPDPKRTEEWVEKGDWQALAADVTADNVFFVDQEPMAVFAQLPSSEDSLFRHSYNRIWCMARPQILFLARPGELAVYDLGAAPMALEDEPAQPNRRPQLLQRVESLAQIQQLRARFHRELIETGKIFGEQSFGKGLNRADYALIRDLKAVRAELAKIPFREGINLPRERRPQILHSLIGRAIFIRYLEDRDIITPAYFEKVIELHSVGEPSKRKEWRKLLEADIPVLNRTMANLFFLRVLTSKEFTYALFDQLAHDFNGDTFPVEPDERRAVLQSHLSMLRKFLLGVPGQQEQLFFHAYNFSIVPIELISSIYEEFYNERVGDDKNQGTHYTPPALVEFLLAHTLTPEVLAKKPRVMDPACGSGIFLVEAFRRMVRHLCATTGKERPTRQELRAILRDQIAGIDINDEAIRVAAFSLYLAFLHYQKPREVLPDPGENLATQPEKLRTVRLPCLKFVGETERTRHQAAKPAMEFFNTLLAANAFDPVTGNTELTGKQSFGRGSADVVVGNPPWGNPEAQTPAEKQAAARLNQWCSEVQGRPVGDNERSQAFIHLTLFLLTPGGKAGLLVSSGVFFKHHENSKAFRKVWLSAVQLRHVVNFAHVRHVFFSGHHRTTKGISPFASVVFEKTPPSASSRTQFEYWSAKRTAVVEKARAVIMTRGDMHRLYQQDCLAYEKIWKIYWWGGDADRALVRRLERNPQLARLGDVIPTARVLPGQGFKEGDRSLDADWLKNYRELRIPRFSSYGPLDLGCLVSVPDRVERRGVEEVFSGRRLLVRQGITSGGYITARLETRPLCFRNSIEGIRFEHLAPWQEQTILGIFWSSLARYYYFTTAGSWGLWHDQLHLENIEQIPIRLPHEKALRDRISRTVARLQDLGTRRPISAGKTTRRKQQDRQMELGLPASAKHISAANNQSVRALLIELDEAVFDLYELSAAERDLIGQMCDLGLDFFYRDHESAAVEPVTRPVRKTGTLADVARAQDGLPAYLRTFLEWWNEELAPDGQFAWRVLSPASGAPLLAVCFETRYARNAKELSNASNEQAWHNVLKLLDEHALVPTGSSRIFTDTFFRVVTEREILIVKRDERRFWTKSAAREDAEAATVRAMNLPSEPVSI